MKKKIYLAGAMKVYGETSDYPRKWREQVKAWFSAYGEGFKVISPTDYYEYGKHYHKTEREVMRFDLRKVKECDVVLVDLSNIQESVGTLQEIFLAYMHNKPIITFLESDTPYVSLATVEQDMHPWMVEQVDRIECGQGAMERAMQYIVDYYG